MAAVGGARDDGNGGRDAEAAVAAMEARAAVAVEMVAWRYKEIRRDVEGFNELRGIRARAVAWTSLAVLAAMAGRYREIRRVMLACARAWTSLAVVKRVDSFSCGLCVLLN